MLKQVFIFWLCMLAVVASAYAQDAEKALKKYEGKTLVLRHPLVSSSQEYDEKGKVLKGGNEGPWTVYSGVLIDHVVLTPEKLRLEGRRIFFLFPDNGLTLFEFHKSIDADKSAPVSPTIKVEIKLDHSVDSEDRAQAILSRVFALDTKSLLASLPDFWRLYMADHLISYDASQKSDAEFHWRRKPKGEIEPVQNINTEQTTDTVQAGANQPVFHIGKDKDRNVKAPEARLTPAPEYSAIAQYEKYRGVVVVNLVVGTDGKVHRVRLFRPLGMGLDEAALAAVQRWRFHPSTHNGEPVAVEMNVEVAFNLY